MLQELIKINSTDNIELFGMLYTPKEKTTKVVIHVHGLYGNFYENKYLNMLAKIYTENGYSFLTFNNRGTDYVSGLLSGQEYKTLGGCYERFKDCLLDLEGVINYSKKIGFTEIILEGHSYGCNKVVYFYNKMKDKSIKKIFLLAPCDIPQESVKFLTKEEYEKAKQESTRLVKEGKESELIDFSANSFGLISAGTFYNDFLPGGENDFIRYSDGTEGKSKMLNNIDIPVLVVFGDVDDCVLTQDIRTVKEYLNNNIKNCDIQIIKGANHSYANHYEELGIIIKSNI